MSKYYYDLHIHSCLSPCADNDMTPNNIAGMAALNGLGIVALTDHNSAKNCRAFYSACKKNGVIPIAGMELTTAEDIHIVCLFRTLEAAEIFDNTIQQYRVLYPNRTDVFGDQLILDANDEIIGKDDYMLPNATMLPIADAVELARQSGAYVYPAHIDREANGIISMLGAVPEELHFTAFEIRDRENEAEYRAKYSLENQTVLVSSDAHYLWDINEAQNYVEIDDEPYSSELVRNRFFDLLESNSCRSCH